MKGRCYTTITGQSISIEILGHSWYITIRRVGNKRFDPFFAFDQEEARVSDIEAFIPNWSSLSWATLPVNEVGHCTSLAMDRHFSIELHGQYWCQTEVISEFMKLMHSQRDIYAIESKIH